MSTINPNTSATSVYNNYAKSQKTSSDTITKLSSDRTDRTTTEDSNKDGKSTKESSNTRYAQSAPAYKTWTNYTQEVAPDMNKIVFSLTEESETQMVSDPSPDGISSKDSAKNAAETVSQPEANRADVPKNQTYNASGKVNKAPAISSLFDIAG